MMYIYGYDVYILSYLQDVSCFFLFVMKICKTDNGFYDIFL